MGISSGPMQFSRIVSADVHHTPGGQLDLTGYKTTSSRSSSNDEGVGSNNGDSVGVDTKSDILNGNRQQPVVCKPPRRYLPSSTSQTSGFDTSNNNSNQRPATGRPPVAPSHQYYSGVNSSNSGYYNQPRRLPNQGSYNQQSTSSTATATARYFGSSSSRQSAVVDPGVCPGCRMPYDKARKRRLIDECGHERCLACICNSHVCPICQIEGSLPPKRATLHSSPSGNDNPLGNPGLDYVVPPHHARPRTITNGHFSALMKQSRSDQTRSPSPESLSRGRPQQRRPFTRTLSLQQPGSTADDDGIELAEFPNGSSNGPNYAATPPVLRRMQQQSGAMGSSSSSAASARMATGSPRLASRLGQHLRNGRQVQQRQPTQQQQRHQSRPQTVSVDDAEQLSALASGKRKKSGAARNMIRKIRSLWHIDVESMGSAGNKENSMELKSHKTVKSRKNDVSNESNNDENMSVRLGLLLGRNNAGASSMSASTSSRSSSSGRGTLTHRKGGAGETTSLLHHYDDEEDGHLPTISDDSPVSTLTGPTEERAAAIMLSRRMNGSARYYQRSQVHKNSNNNNCHGDEDTVGHDVSGDSLGSLMSSCSSPHFGRPGRRHSITTTQQGPIEELNLFGSRQHFVRRSARAVLHRSGAMGNSAYQPPQLNLKPLFFEVPQQEADSLFIGRRWVFKEVETELISGCESPSSSSTSNAMLNQRPGSRGVVLSGNVGNGKTALILQIVDYSCFGRKREDNFRELYGSRTALTMNGPTSSVSTINLSQSSLGASRFSLVSDSLKIVGTRVVGFHFCQADNAPTCLVPDFVHSLAAQLSQAPQLAAYREFLLQNPAVVDTLTMKECIHDPHRALVQGILEPLSTLRRIGRLSGETAIIVVDSLCEAEYHKPDYGDTIASFLTRHVMKFPAWLKLIVTVRSQRDDVTRLLPFRVLSLDDGEANMGNVRQDLEEYVNFRLCNSMSIMKNISVNSGSKKGQEACNKFVNHMVTLAKGSFLYVKLTLDLIERGHLIMKSSSYKVLPVNTAEIFMLNFNLRFRTGSSYERVADVLATCLASLSPMTAQEIFQCVNAGNSASPVPWEDFTKLMATLQSFLVRRGDQTYMMFHPSFRDWLVRRNEGESPKFLVDRKRGSACIALHLANLGSPLGPDRGQELGHHLLKAHLFKQVTAFQQRLQKSGSFHAIGQQKSNNSGVKSLFHGILSSSSSSQASSGPHQQHEASSVTTSIAVAVRDASEALVCHRNVFSPNVKVSRLLLLSGASPDQVTGFLNNAPLLCVAAKEGFLEMVSLLLEFGANPEAANTDGMTPLAFAARQGRVEIVRLLVERGACVNAVDNRDWCPLVHAAHAGFLNVVSFLVSCDWIVRNDADLGLEEAAQQALSAAALRGHAAVVDFLLDMAEVNINQVDTLFGETPLTAAASCGLADLCVKLLRRGAAVEVGDLRDSPPLVRSIKEGHWEAADVILTHGGARVDQPDGQRRTPLMVAAAEGHVALVEMLLGKGCDVGALDRDKMTALSWACLRGHLVCVQVLMDGGCDINHVDKFGRSPLDLAAEKGHFRVVQLLVDRDAEVEHVDLNGVKPLDRAIQANQLEVVNVFLRKGAKLGSTTWTMACGKYPILLTLLKKLLEDGQTLLKKGRVQDAAFRFQYASKKLPGYQPVPEGMSSQTSRLFAGIHLSLVLGLSRCKRKLNEPDEALELASKAVEMRPDSFEAFYARARVLNDMGKNSEALQDLTEAIRLAPQNRDVRRVLLRVKEEMKSAGFAEVDDNANPSGATATLGPAASIETLSHFTGGSINGERHVGFAASASSASGSDFPVAEQTHL